LDALSHPFGQSSRPLSKIAEEGSDVENPKGAAPNRARQALPMDQEAFCRPLLPPKG